MKPIAYLLFTISGALGLVYEVVWMRELHLVFGASAPAVATTLAVFMLGLALGAWWLGRYMARSTRSPWTIYGVLEILVALFAWVFPLALHALDPLFRLAYGSVALFPLRFLAATVLLLPATICLGGTLPVMARALEGHPRHFARHLAWLYAANTAGAALGAFLAPFALIPTFGTRLTQIAMPVLNIVVGLVAMRLARQLQAEPATAGSATAAQTVPAVGEVPAVEAPRTPRRPLERRLALALAFLSGFVVLLLEVAVTRILAIYLGQSTYGFGLMLTCFILGLALGAWLAGAAVERVRSDARLVAPLLMLGGLLIGVMVLMLEQVPWWLTRGLLVIHTLPIHFPLMVAWQFVLALAALLPPVVALGMIFPVLLGSAGEREPGSSRAVGFLYGVNTAGAVLAALLGGFLLVPLLGPQGVVIAAGVLTLVAGGVVMLSEMRADKTYARAAALQSVLPVAAIALFLVAGTPDPRVLMRTPWLYARNPELLENYTKELAASTRSVEFLAHDSHGTVAVGKHNIANPPYLFFSVNGKIDGGAGSDMFTQVALAAWPCVLFDGGRRDPKDVLVIGLGTGVTAAAALSFPIASLDVVEISPTMPYVARQFFAEQNRHALDDPRTHLVIGDGRHHLGYANKTYDVIISEPSNPWISGIGFLFTQENFRLMRDALTDGGVACQWLQLYDLPPESIAASIKTFASVFPSSIVMMAQEDPVDLLLLGFKRDLPADGKLLDAELIEGALKRRVVPPEFAPYGVQTLDDLLRRFMLGPAGIAELTREAPINTDDNGYLEFEAPKLLATEGDMTPTMNRLGTYWEPAARYLALPADRARTIANNSMNVALWWRLGCRTNVEALSLVSQPAQGNRQTRLENAQAAQVELNDFATLFGQSSLLFRVAGVLAEMRVLENSNPPTLERYAPGYEPTQARAYFEQGLQLEPDNVPLQLDLATNYEYGTKGDRWGAGAELAKAADIYRKIQERAPDFPDACFRLVQLLARTGEARQAEKLAGDFYVKHPTNPDAGAWFADMLLQQNKTGQARKVLESVVAGTPDHARSLRLLGTVLAKQGDRTRAQEYLQRALKLNPQDRESETILRELQG